MTSKREMRKRNEGGGYLSAICSISTAFNIFYIILQYISLISFNVFVFMIETRKSNSIYIAPSRKRVIRSGVRINSGQIISFLISCGSDLFLFFFFSSFFKYLTHRDVLKMYNCVALK